MIPHHVYSVYNIRYHHVRQFRSLNKMFSLFSRRNEALKLIFICILYTYNKHTIYGESHLRLLAFVNRGLGLHEMEWEVRRTTRKCRRTTAITCRWPFTMRITY